MGRHSAPPSPAPLILATPVRTGPRHARPTGPRQPGLQVLIAGPLARPALHRPAHRRATPAPSTAPTRAPLWRRSPAVPAAVAVLAVWSGANLPHLLTAGHAAPAVRAASAEIDLSALAAGLGSTSDALGMSTATRPAAADRRVSRASRTLPTAAAPTPTDAAGVGSKALGRPVALRPAAKHRAPVSHWVRPSAGGESSCFCMRWGVMHEGIDLAGPLGSPIVAVGDGVVVEAGPAAGFGLWVVIKHANGDYSIYGHMYQYYVTVGEHVRAGQRIADIGANGQSTGPHLHFGVSAAGPTGPYLDPVPWLRARGVQVGPYDPDA